MANPYPADFVDDSGIVRESGFVDFTDAGNQPGGSSSFTFRGPKSFTFATAGLAAGIPFYTPAVDEILFDAWIEVITAFDGTTPQADIGRGDGDGLWADLSQAVFLDSESGTNNVLSGFRDLLVFQSAQSSTLVLHTTQGAHTAHGVFTTADPLLLWASQEGTIGGTPLDSTVGSARLYLITATPTPFT